MLDLGNSFLSSVERDPDALAIVDGSVRLTYAQWYRRISSIDAAFDELGLMPGDHLVTMLQNRWEAATIHWACQFSGVVITPINWRSKDDEVDYYLENAEAKAIVFEDVSADAIRASGIAKTRTRIALDAAQHGEISFLTLLTREASPAEPRVGADSWSIMLYTSGTTSRPRGCLHSHASLVEEGEAVTERLGLRPDDRFWTPLPMFHCGGFDVAVSAMAGRCGMVHVGTFEPARALAQLADERCTVGFPAFDTIWVPVLDHPSFPDTDLSALRMVLNVGSPERMRSMQARLPHVVQMSCTGSTESFGFCCMGSPDDPAEVRATTCGRPLRHMQARVVDPETGVDVAPGTPGEFRFRGGSRFMRYHRDDALTAERIDADGWYSSGDLVVADAEGRIAFVSRLKDMLKVGGENVAAAELEGFLSEHPAVGLVQVVAAPDAHYGEVPAAFVQLRVGATATEDELIDFCRGSIAGFKVPRYVRFVDEWPMSGTKVQKFRLRDALAAELSAAGVTEAPRPTPA